MSDLMHSLVDLCKVDAAAETLREQLELYPAMLAELDAREGGLKRRIHDAGERFAEARDVRRKAELDVADEREKINKYLGQQGAVKTNKEYQAITQEIDTVRARIDALDSKGLEALEAEEQAENEQREVGQELERVKGEIGEERERIQAQIAEKKERLAVQETEHVRRLAEIPEDLQELYQLLEDRYPGDALAVVAGGVCGGCNMSLVHQRVFDARRGDGAARCDNCTRILYDPASLEADRSAGVEP